MAKYISVLGSTGSIGKQTLEVVKELNGEIKVCAVSANRNIDLLEKQIYDFKPPFAAVFDEVMGEKLKSRLVGTRTKVLTGVKGFSEIAALDMVDTVLSSIVGNAGIVPTIEAVKAKKSIALANKEALVSAGEIIIPLIKKYGVDLLPVDSEHSAIFQCLQGNKENSPNKIILTASGGPFRDVPAEELSRVTPADALKHPNWSMGKKITIDSATMMNKGLEVIEASWLFGVKVENIEVVIHPQSIMHSAVEFDDGAVIAQLGEPDMRVPIQYALTYPKRMKNSFPRLDLFKRGTLTFEKPDTNKFKCLSLAYRAAKLGGTAPAVLNAANEAAVSRFLNGEIRFLDIPEIIEHTILEYKVKYNYTLDELLDMDRKARCYANKLVLTR